MFVKVIQNALISGTMRRAFTTKNSSSRATNKTLQSLLEEAKQKFSNEEYRKLKNSMPKTDQIEFDYYNLSGESGYPASNKMSTEALQVKFIKKALTEDSNFSRNAKWYLNKKD